MSMPRFVLLYHDCPPDYSRPSHWDLMLERGDLLVTWALERLPHQWQTAYERTANVFPNSPQLAERNEVPAQQLGDHRREYLGFEGEVGGNRGRVIRVAAGTYHSGPDSLSSLEFSLSSDAIAGPVVICRARIDDDQWILSCGSASESAG